METNITIFSSELFGQIRTTKDERQNPIFCLSDICNALGIHNSADLKTRLNPKGVVSTYTLTKGGRQLMDFVNEPKLYRCIFQSRKKSAIQFQDWIFEEVLPSIRKTGSYSCQREIKQLQQENHDLQAKLETIEKRITNHKHNGHLTSTTKLAKMYGLEVGELIEKLDEKAFIIYFANMMILTPMSEGNAYAEYVTWWKGNRKIEYVGWTDKGISAIVQELNLS